MTIRAVKEPHLGVKLAAFPYQEAAAERVRDLEYAAVFHEMGLGKSKIGIDVLMHWLETLTVDSVIIVTKRSLLQNWRDELKMHTFIEPRMLDQDRLANHSAFNAPARIYLCHYEVFASERKRLGLFLRTRKVGVVLDEAQRIKNPAAAVTQAFLALRGGFVRRLIMTGTPVANRPQDVWAQAFFLDGGRALGTDYAEFTRQVNLTNDLGFDDARRRDFENQLEQIPKRMAAFCVRETKASSGIVLPPKTIFRQNVELESYQAEIYKAYLEELENVVTMNGTAILDSADEVLKRLTRLIQVCSNPRLVDESYGVESGKSRALLSLVGQIVDRGEKTIVWTGFVKNAGWIAEDLASFRAVVVHGELGLDERNAALNTFKKDATCGVLVATPGAAKEGLTLTVANNAIFYDRSLSLDDYLQAQDRIHRISQTKPCTVTNLIAINTVDEWVEALLRSKAQAAKLAQGDVSSAAFRQDMVYDYATILKSILQAARRARGKGRVA